MNIIHEPRKGYSFLTDGGDIDELAHELNRVMIPHIPQPMDVPRVRGAVKAFWFSWSNGQAAWDAVAWKDFPWHLDGAGFFVFIGKNALSPLKKLWSATEMNYVARKLTNHPGYGSSPESASGRRRWASEPVNVIPRRIQDALDEQGIKADGGYFSTGTVFTAWWNKKPVAVLDYQSQTKTWTVRPKGYKGPSVRFDWDTMSTSGVPSRRVADRYLDKLAMMITHPNAGQLYVIAPEGLSNLLERHDWAGIWSGGQGMKEAERLFREWGGGIIYRGEGASDVVILHEEGYQDARYDDPLGDPIDGPGRTAALVGTDTSIIYAIAPEMLMHLINEGQWKAEWFAGHYSEAEKLIRQHGGAVFHTGGDSTLDVFVPKAEVEWGFMYPYHTEDFTTEFFTKRVYI